jgi:hypothetical protein
MTSTVLKELLKARPFQPFTLILSSGDRFPVRHPEFLFVLKDRVLAAVEPDIADDEPSEFRIISFLHIAATEPLNEQQRLQPQAG